MFMRLWWSLRSALALVLTGMSVLTGCAVGGGAAGSADSVTTLPIEVPVHEPIWSHDTGDMLALTEKSSRIARIDPGARSSGTGSTARTTLSARLPDTGENLALSPTGSEEVYLPQPALGRIAVFDIANLHRVGTLPTGHTPSRVATDVGSDILFALSKSGRTVTGTNLNNSTSIPPVEVRAGPEAELHGPERGRPAEFFVLGPRGIAVYEGHPAPLEKTDDIGIGVSAVAGDTIKVSRVYVAEAGTDRLLAVGLDKQGKHLRVAAEARLGEPVEHLGVDHTRIYAATHNKLVVLETNSFTGFEHGHFTKVDTIEFRRHLENRALRNAPLSGLAVGSDRVYLTLRGQPAAVSIDKPSL
ncbi:hypothetical protein DFQ14_102279 [Halopolyspora algeriensis]|uniref:DNA-binding beta-propeller fold protein YncE n=1 Tax=Halopolyspora algeriensis TaxID=1500506 RepID=A0A368VXD6_9ACTN|nr:hypothetical protein [Halopolyspora algeriensis]RCW45977.1 hypothetical protein DFQ14_102279 [Halopolyspora algeriensis]TQM55390.1 hypothetical protein FHU43_0153 [Halopolyspora algeriensis]